MRTLTPFRLGRPLAALAIAVLVGCGQTNGESASSNTTPPAITAAADSDGDGVSDNSDPDPNDASVGGNQEDPYGLEDSTASGPSITPTKIGQVLDLSTSDTYLQVNVTGIIDPLPPGEDTPMTAGARFVGVRVAVKNTGPDIYDGTSGNDVTMRLRGGGSADQGSVFSGECALHDNDFLERVAVGERRRGCVTFEVPAGGTIKNVRFTPDSGYADETGEWTP